MVGLGWFARRVVGGGNTRAGREVTDRVNERMDVEAQIARAIRTSHIIV